MRAARRAPLGARGGCAIAIERNSWRASSLRAPALELLVADVLRELLRAVGQRQILHVNEVPGSVSRRMATNRHLVAGLHFVLRPADAHQLRARTAFRE